MKTRYIFAIIPALILLLIMSTSCRISYKLNGSAINYDIYKTIDIGEFPIRAALVYPPLQSEFQNQLMDAVARQTRLQEIDGNPSAKTPTPPRHASLSPYTSNIPIISIPPTT